MPSSNVSNFLLVLLFTHYTALPFEVMAGSTNTDISMVDSNSQGTASLAVPTDINISENEDLSQDLPDDFNGPEDTGNMNNAQDANLTVDGVEFANNDSKDEIVSMVNDTDHLIASDYHMAAGIPLWAQLEVEDTETHPTDLSDTKEASATATDEYNAHPKNLSTRWVKDYELSCAGQNMGHIMRKCGDAPPITGYLCQATCYCTKAGCMECRNQGLGICSLDVLEATCKIPNTKFACTCNVKGARKTNGFARICNS